MLSGGTYLWEHSEATWGGGQVPTGSLRRPCLYTDCALWLLGQRPRPRAANRPDVPEGWFALQHGRIPCGESPDLNVCAIPPSPLIPARF